MTCRYKVRYGLPADARLAAAAKRAGLPRGMALAVWIALHDYAGRNTPHGTVTGLSAEDVAALLDFDTAAVDALLQAFRDKKMLDSGDALKDWGEVSPVTRRTRRHRARKRQEMRDAVWRAPLPGDDPDDPAAVARRRARLQEERRRIAEKHRPTATKPIPPEKLT